MSKMSYILDLQSLNFNDSSNAKVLAICIALLFIGDIMIVWQTDRLTSTQLTEVNRIWLMSIERKHGRRTHLFKYKKRLCVCPKKETCPVS